MNKIIIGSTAMKYHFSDFNRVPKDLDYAVLNSKEFKQSREIEYLENPILFKYTNEEYIPPNMLLTLKISHLFWDINWDKHLWDIQFLLKKGCIIQMDLFNDLLQYWKDTKEKVRRSDLMMSKEDFFSNAINYDEHEHDHLHTLLNPIPMYTRILADGAEVELDESKFIKLSHEDKCAVVFEETAVMAYERYKKSNYNVAFIRMLKKCIMQHFPIYIAIFAIENYIELHKPKYNFIETITNGLKQNQRSTQELRPV